MGPDQFFDALADIPNMRAATFDDLEIKDGGNVFLFDGYAAVYNQPADLGEFSEEVAPGAFRSVLAGGPNVPMLHEHHPHQLLATTKSGRLKLTEDTRGLRAQAKLVKTDLSARVKALVDSGDITGMSYGFIAGRDNQQVDLRNGKPHRLLTGSRSFSMLDDLEPCVPVYGGAVPGEGDGLRRLARVVAAAPHGRVSAA
jgi:HK97 family phage prohead protease